VAEVQVWRSWVEAGLHSQRPTFFQLFNQVFLWNQLINTPFDNRQRFIY
jgi:hypothetical protein